jgi:hypothetical protein
MLTFKTVHYLLMIYKYPLLLNRAKDGFFVFYTDHFSTLLFNILYIYFYNYHFYFIL